MNLRAIRGDLVFAALFAAVGLLWVVKAFSLDLWSGFAPGSGFLPLLYGGMLLVLSVGVLVTLILYPQEEEEKAPLGKSLKLLAALILTVASLSFIGFAIPLFLMMLFMFAYVEEQPLVRSVIVSASVTAVFLVVFKSWLGIPVPLFPWSF